MLIDSHAHLKMFEPDDLRERILPNAADAGVTTICTIGTTLEDSRGNIELAHQYPGVWATVGVHPHEVADTPCQTLEAELSRLAADERVIGLGEIGLDFYRDLSPRDLQEEYFRRQLILARTLGLPVIIHDRDAHQEVLQILQEIDMSAVGGVFHCFSSDLGMAQQLYEMGFLISIAGPITFNNPRHLPEVVAKMPLEALLLETDCPFLAPVPFRGKRNEPAYVRYTAEKVAQVRGISVERVAEATSQNFAQLFHLMG